VGVRAAQREETYINNRDHASVRARILVDIVVTKTTATPVLPAGSDVEDAVTVANDGPSDASSVRFADALPAGLALRAIPPLQGTCSGLGCQLGALRAGGSTQVLITAASDPSLVGQTVRNRAGALAVEPELTLANNLGFADVTFQALPPSPP